MPAPSTSKRRRRCAIRSTPSTARSSASASSPPTSSAVTWSASTVKVRRCGDKRRLVELSWRNAHQAFVDKERERGAQRTALERLQSVLHLQHEPAALECFDISHLQGAQVVASVVRFENGAAQKDRYR